MTRRLNAFVLAMCALLFACEQSEEGDAEPDAGARPDTADDGFEESQDPIKVSDGSVDDAMDAAATVDAGQNPRDAGAVGRDAGKTKDAGRPVPTFDDDCEEVFVFDPTGIDDVKSVVLTGDYSRWTWWVPTVGSGALPMQLGTDGRYYARVWLDQEIFRYKFVVNGDSPAAKWLEDTANCHDENDNFGGRNSVRYACQMAPMCEVEPMPDAGTTKDAGLDAGETDAGETDAGETDAGETDAGGADSGTTPDDAGLGDSGVLDGGFDSAVPDAGPLLDAGSQDAGTVLDAGDPDEVDVELGDDCVEAFEVDPALYPEFAPILSVELRGAAPLSYDEAVIALQEDEDGVFRATARIDQVQFKYNVVLNGKDYVRDRGYCPSADDGFGGRGASLRSTCEVPACCENIAIEWDPAASSCGEVEGAAFVGELATWQKPGKPMTLGEDGKYRISFRDAPGTYQYKVIVEDAYISAPDDDCTDDGEAALVVKACVE